jgi:hypothetical protein
MLPNPGDISSIGSLGRCMISHRKTAVEIRKLHRNMHYSRFIPLTKVRPDLSEDKKEDTPLN